MIRTALVSLFDLACFAGCDSNDNRVEGVCYCTFFRSDPQEYDLRAMSRADQVTECQRNNSNAANFGRSCKLKEEERASMASAPAEEAADDQRAVCQWQGGTESGHARRSSPAQSPASDPTARSKIR